MISAISFAVCVQKGHAHNYPLNRDCRESVEKFVSHGYKSKMLPLPVSLNLCLLDL